jgi:very-short-patch-repair endonuclease
LIDAITLPHSWFVHPFAVLPASVCKKRKAGRKAEALPEEVRKRWCADSNGGPAPASGRDSTQQAFFILDCGCKTKIQVKTAVKNQQAVFQCRVHGTSGKGLSAWQALAAWMLQRLPLAGPVSVEQYRLLQLAQKPVDFVLEAWNLWIEVDGQQHASSSSGFGAAAGEQCERDRSFERLVLSSGSRLLRLHWADVPKWPLHVLAAIFHICAYPNSSFVWYSASFLDARRLR